MKPTDILFSKNGHAAQQIARDLLLTEVGERIPTIQEYSRLLGFGSGTVQQAVNSLVDSEAVSLRRRGHQGTFLVAKDVVKLWAFAGLAMCVGSMPLPNSREFQGLASGLRREFERLQIPFGIVYCHGGDMRLDFLLNKRVDFIIVSRNFASRIVAENDELVALLDFGEGSYYAADSVVVVSRGDIKDIKSIRRVGIDTSSPDHRELSRAEFRDVEWVEVTYIDIPEAILEGEIDGAVWHRTALPVPLDQLGLKVHPLSGRDTIELSEQMSSAVVVSRMDSYARAVFPLLDVDKILQVQRQVIERALQPIY